MRSTLTKQRCDYKIEFKKESIDEIIVKVDRMWRLRASNSSNGKWKYYSLMAKHSEKCTNNDALQFVFQFYHQSSWWRAEQLLHTTYSLISVCMHVCILYMGFNGTSVNNIRKKYTSKLSMNARFFLLFCVHKL